MSTRLPVLDLVAPPDLLKAAERILAQPTCNVQRVSLNEIYTFAVATTQLAEISVLAAALLTGSAGAAERARLREHLLSLGVVSPSFTPQQPKQEPSHVD